jgi:hypothetical protein
LVNVSISDAAAKTVIVPVEGELPELGELGLLEQPARATASRPAVTTAKRRTAHSLVRSREARSVDGGDLD